MDSPSICALLRSGWLLACMLDHLESAGGILNAQLPSYNPCSVLLACGAVIAVESVINELPGPLSCSQRA